MKTRIIVDSTADLMPEYKERVQIVPLTVHFGDQEYIDGVTIDHKTFYEKLVESDVLPTTSQATPDAFMKEFDKVKEAGEAAVVITISSKLSGTYQSACIAANGFEDCIYVVDTRTVSVAQRILLDYAISFMHNGNCAKEIAAELEEKKADVRAFGAVETLEYLIKGGRLSKAAGAVGSVLGIRPVLCLSDGALEVAGKARGAKAAVTLLHDLIADIDIDFSMPYCVGYTGNDPHVIDAYLDASNSALKGRELTPVNVGSTVGTHTGPGLFIVAFFKKS